MAKITSYIKNNKTFYKFKAYLGINQLTGNRVNVSRSGFATKREAKIVLDRLTYEFKNSRQYNNEEITFKEMFDVWFPVYSSTVSESTQARVKGIFVHHALPYFGKMKIAEIKVQTCQRFVDDLSETIQDINKVGNYVGLVFKYAMKLEFIQKNPMALITYPQRQAKQNTNFWTADQFNIFLGYLDTIKSKLPKTYVYLRLLAMTGARKGEILALHVDDYDYSNKSIKIALTVTRSIDNKQKLGPTKTVSGVRTLYLDDKTATILEEWLNTGLDDYKNTLGLPNPDGKQLIFPNDKNKMLSLMKPNDWLDSIINGYNKSHNNKLKRITPHGLRHTMATLLSQSGATIKQVQLQLGDSDVETVLNTYTHLDEKLKKETPNLIFKLLQNS